MSDLSHQHLVEKFNRRAETERMNDMEHRATPLFYAVMSIAAAVVLWTLTADYRDVIQHRLDTMAYRQQSELISATLARCANGEVVAFGEGVIMQCTTMQLLAGVQ